MRSLVWLAALSATVSLCAPVAAQTLVATDDQYGVPYASDLLVEAPGLLSNDTVDGGSAAEAGATAELLSFPTYGSLSCDSDPSFDLCPDGSFIYTPGAGFAGFDSFSYQVVLDAHVAPATVLVTACTGGPVVFTCWEESAYLAKVAELGYHTFQEGFENDAVWSEARDPLTAPFVISQGIRWETNHPDPPASNEIITGDGPARTGLWGVYDKEHGFALDPTGTCDVNNPSVDCLYKDGFTGIKETGGLLYAVGGQLTGVLQPNMQLILDGGAPTGLGMIYIGGHQFFGVIDTGGFSSFRFEETDGKVGQQRLVFGDDFTMAVASADSTPPRVEAIGSVTDTGDGVLGESEIATVPISQLVVGFDELMRDIDFSDPGSASNPDNYLLVNDGGDGFETTSCSGGVAGNDQAVSVDWVEWLSGSELTATLDINGGSALANGSYALMVCGTTSLTDWAGNHLDGDGNGVGGDDFVRTFQVAIPTPPTALPDQYPVVRGETLTITAPGVLANDSGSAPLTATLVSGPSHATSFALNPDGSFTYTHDGLTLDNDAFIYRAYDGMTYSSTVSVSLVVGPAPFHWYVSPLGDDAADCLSPATPCASVGEAVSRSLDGDTIDVSTGLYAEHLYLAKNLTLNGAMPDTVLDGSGSGVVVEIAAGATVGLAGFEIRNGLVGGVDVSGDAAVSDCWIHGNGDGGAGSFGGLRNTGTSSISCTSISNNLGDASAAIANSGQLQISNSTVYANQASLGAAIDNLSSSSLSVGFTTVADNGDTGIRNTGTLLMDNSIVSGHLVRNCDGTITSQGHNIEDADTCGLEPLAGDLVATDPLLASFANHGGPTPTVSLAAVSPAIDAAASAASPATDQRGYPRPVDGDGDGAMACDIGAFESPLLIIFRDDFESGTTTAWSATTGG